MSHKIFGISYDDAANALSASNISDSLTFNNTGTEGNVAWTASGYTQISTINDSDFMSTSNFINLDTQMSATVTQPNPRKPFKCNFSFNFSFNLSLALPNIFPGAPNMSLLYSIDSFSKEVSELNDLLIQAIQDLNCCDIEDAIIIQ